MYRCGICLTVVGPSVRLMTKVMASRSKSYPFRRHANPLKIKGRWVEPHDDPGGSGWEIVKEVAVCKECSKGT